MAPAQRRTSCQKTRPRPRRLVASTAPVQGTRNLFALISMKTFATIHTNGAPPRESAPINTAIRHEFLRMRSIASGVAAQIRIFGNTISRAAILVALGMTSRWKFSRICRLIFVNAETSSCICRKRVILPVRKQALSWQLQGFVALADRRSRSSQEKQTEAERRVRLNEIQRLTTPSRPNIRADSDIEPQSARLWSPGVQSTLVRRGGRQISGDAPTRLDGRVRMQPTRSRAFRRLSVACDPDLGRFVPAGNLNKFRRHVREGQIARELSGASTNECAGLTFLRRGMQMFCDVANWSVFGRQRLFHQKTRKHRGGSFVEPLFEKSINFLFKIGCMIQSGKFKGLECRDGGLLKILPRWADTSGHFGGLLG